MDIQCVDFQLRSSPAVERLRLNERVRFAVTTRFSCEGAPGRGPLLSQTQRRCAPSCCAGCRAVTCWPQLPAEGIRSTTRVQAEVAPPAPFSYLPDGVLVTVGEAAVHGALANLQVHSLSCIVAPRGMLC